VTHLESDVVLDVRNLELDFPTPMRPGKAKAGKTPSSSDPRLTKAGPGKLRGLDDISFTARRGDRIGLIGRNGAGKSTLLRTLAGIYPPSAGSCRATGRISTLFSSALGLSAEATGYENIYLGATLLGLNKAAIEEALPDIVDFCELGDFLELPIRTYSAGMRTRLGFAIATSIRPDILLIDEVFGTGDRHFRAKAKQRIEQVMAKANVLMLASHSDGVIRSMCTKALWLEQGRVMAFGPVNEVLEHYNQDPTSTEHPSAEAS
jgi:ABC-2 type transport system ATP-binding protein/lipopolysaccharide transport system ATP-binding protein